MNEFAHLRESLKFQFNLSWQLLEYHLNNLESEELLWKPTENSLHLQEVNGDWKADWPNSESYEMGPPSIAWTTWHIQFWWSMVFDYSFGKGTLTKEEVHWSGNVEDIKATISKFKEEWLNQLDALSDKELQSTQYTKWPFEDLPFYQLAGWLNLELMKNASEIGSVRFMYGSKRF